jgi:hypothetical protein
LSSTLPFDILYSLYNTIVNPYFDYCNIAWATNATTKLDKLNRIQKKALCIITKSKWNAHTTPLFRSKNILKICDINSLQVGCFVYKATHNILPPSFCNYFMLNSDVHDHYTRKSSDIHSLESRTSIRQYNVRLYGIKIWNSIPTDIKQSKSIHIFKRKYKYFLLFQYT